VAQYPQVYDPFIRLELSEPLTDNLIEWNDLQLPSVFAYNAVIVSDEGKPLTKDRLHEFPSFVISLTIKLSASASPAIMEVRTWGNTLSRRFDSVGLRQWNLDTQPVTPWQLQFVSKYRSRLVTRAVATVARDWKPTFNGEKLSGWQIPFGSAKNVTSEQVLTLEKHVAKKFRQKFDDNKAEEFARRYLKYEGQGLKPIQELQQDHPGVPIRTLQRWATTCRRRELLPKTTQGKASSVSKKGKGKNARKKKAK